MQRTLVELVTCFSASPGPTTLSLAPEAAYNGLLRRLAASDKGLSYDEVAVREGVTLDSLFCPDWVGAFWASYLGDEDRDHYPDCGWNYFLPINGSLRNKLLMRNPPRGLKVTPQPLVWIFPSGCAISISLMVTGQHDLIELASLVRGISNGQLPFCWEDSLSDITLGDLRKELADALKKDILAKTTSWQRSQSCVMSTILDSGRKLLYRREALAPPLVNAIEHIIKPRGPAFTLTDQLMIRPKNEDDAQRYFVAATDYSFLIWLPRLLLSNDPQDVKRLRRYHDNTVRSLLILWQQRTLLERVISEGHRPSNADRAALTQNAITRLSAVEGGYGNRVLRVARNGGLKELLAAANASMAKPQSAAPA